MLVSLPSKQQCLFVQALKERLVERANIIQARHDSETAALVKRQACSLQSRHKHDLYSLITILL